MDGRSVAMRLFPPGLLAPDVLPGLVADLKAASSLSHPNLVKVLGLVEVQGRRCLVTELVAGRHFGEAVRSGHRMNVKQAHSLGRVLAQVLALVHEKGLVHGSLQPSNLMVAGGVVKVADLGLGRLAQRLPPGPEPDYRAPEGEWNAAGDLYALAAVLYHLLTGVHPKSQSQGVALPLPSTPGPRRAGGLRQAAAARAPSPPRDAPAHGRGRAGRAQGHGPLRLSQGAPQFG